MTAETHTTINPDEAKFKELVLYVCRKCESDPAFGATKLNKILYYSDFYSYLLHGKPITGVAYQHLRLGPAPRPLLRVKERLLEDKEAVETEREYPSGVQKRIVAVRRPDLSGFSGEEIAIVDQVIEWLQGKKADEVSDLSHLEIGWEVTAEGEDIPYETVLVDNKAPSASDIDWAQEEYARRQP